MKKLSLQLISAIFLLIFLLPVSLGSSQQSNVPLPTIDGFWGKNEWPSSIINSYTFNDNKVVQFAYRVNATDIFMTARYLDMDPSFYNVSCTSILYGICADSFAIGFDLNGDQANMGSRTSPDDAVFIGMTGNSSLDVFMQGISKGSITYDTAHNGTEDSFGRLSYNTTTHYFTFEVVKKLHSGDANGHDIELHLGDSIKVMLAYWNDLPPKVEISGYSNWIKIKIDDPLNNVFNLINFIPPMLIALAISVSIIFIKMYLEHR